jgi:hypothetical protein
MRHWQHLPGGLGDAPTPQPAPAPQIVERPFDYAYQVTLTANQSLADQVLAITGDADFIIRAICGTQTGAYSIRLRDAKGTYLSSAAIRNANLVGTRQWPTPVFPELVIPRAGKIGIDITDLSAAPNTIEIVFIGVKRYQE